jgi:broad specificity polyphosphatase/5'/3'-nucleotidase SurE
MVFIDFKTSKKETARFVGKKRNEHGEETSERSDNMSKEINWLRNKQEAFQAARDRDFPVMLDFHKEG